MMKYGGGGGHFDHHNHQQQQQQHQQQQHLHQRQQQQQQQQRGVIAPTSSNNCTMFAMDAQSSVIKTAPPGRANTANNPVVSNSAMMMDFSPKQEPIDLAPLTNSHPCLQDLSKMPTQLEHYYVASAKGVPGGAAGYGAGAGPAYYEYLNVGSAAYPTPTQPGPSGAAVASAALLQPTAAAVVALQGTTSNHQQQQHTAHHQDWPYMSYAHAGLHQQQQQQLQAVQQQQLNGYLDVVMEQHQQQQQQQQQQQRLYCSGIGGGTGKAVDAVTAATLAVSAAAGGIGTAGVSGGLLSPVDSGIGTELSLLEHAKQLHEFFGPGASLASAAVLQLPPAQTQHVQQPSASSASLQSVIHHQQQQQQEQLVVVAGAVQQQQQHHRRGDHHGGGGSSRSGGESSHHRESQHREQSLPVVIPKLDNPLGFQYALEAPISTSIRREDDRMTYVNKGQFYTVSLDYIPDLHRPLKGLTVRSQVMVVFREDKSFDEELRTWMLWHKRQHSHKQRIIEVDVKNCSGAIGGQYDEMAYNAVQFCWNPAEQPGPKVSIAVQCLSTDFSTQKGVKGLPLHVQIDTFDDQADSKQPFHRAYCQIKVFCDKGAERKLRDEDKRADKRRKTNSSSACPDQPSSNDNSGASGTGGGGGRKKMEGDFHEAADRSHFYHSADLERPAALFVPGDDFFDTASIGSYDALSELEPQPKRPRTSERIMIYVRKQGEEIFTPLHLVPPTLGGLARAVSEKYNLDESKIEAFYKQCLKGLTVKIDDDMLRHYSNQDTFQIELKQSELDRHTFYSVTLIELLSVNNSIVHPHQQQQQHSSTPSTTSNSSSSSSSSTSSAAAAVAAAVEQQHLLNNNNNSTNNNNNVVVVGTPVQMQNGGAQLQNQRTPVW